MITKYGNGTVIQIATVFERVYQLPGKGSFETGLFGQISNHVFWSA